MTTIVCNRKYMVADKRCTREDGVVFKTIKLRRLDDSILGFAGDLNEGYRFLNLYPSRDLRLDSDFEGIILRKSGIFTVDKDLLEIPIDQDYFSIGSGSQIAMNALDNGATPIQALREAIRIDFYTGCGITVRNLK